MKNNEDCNDLMQSIGNILKYFSKVQEEELLRIVPIAENLIETKSKDIQKIEQTLDSIFELVLF
ncbi:hypothetical protein Bcop_2098 [Bacteroides coprosuis DSM 18011]|uniref:Uncharacterized protein n=1 Tax=Bacteroides coprosuis DSM 18011 TaxID=679937 RepID=F3ZTA2_9BACE|nr:hypothetical protein [Bacteroides coprosuis]EGJ72270.1 hypothetical protein Bcop_2098 [Bacteroides coprosuis DSM 18011]